jgi:hypothetical protein
MKRIFQALAVGLLIAGALSILVIQKDRVADPLAFLPADTLALVDVRQPAALYDQFRHSRLGKRFSAIRWGELLRQFGVSEEEAGAFQEEVDQLQGFLNGPLFRELFARRVVLALLPDASGSRALADQRNSLVLIASPRHRTEVVELLAPLLPDNNQQVIETYQGFAIRTFHLADELEFAVVASDGLLIASLSAATVKRCLDLDLRQPNSEKSPLSSNPAYLDLRKRSAGHDDQFVYGDLQAASRLLHSVAGSGQGISAPPGWPAEGDSRHGALFCGPRMGRFDCTAILPAHSGEADAGTPPPAVDTALAAVPADMLFHYWSNLLDLSRIVAGLRHIPRLRDPLASAEDWLVRKTGMSFSDFFSLFDRQFSLTVTGMRGNGFFPLPRLCCRLVIKDEELLREALVALMAGKSQVSKEVAGVRINTLVLAGGLLQPSWAISNGLVYFADSPEQLEQNLVQPHSPLNESPLFRKVDVGLEEPNNMITFVNYPRLMDGLQRLAAWGATILAMVDQERGSRARAVVDLFFTPLLDGMKMAEAGSSRLIASPSGLVWESALILADRTGREEEL